MIDDFFTRACEIALSENAARQIERDFDDLVSCAMSMTEEELAHAKGVHAVRRELMAVNHAD